MANALKGGGGPYSEVSSNNEVDEEVAAASGLGFGALGCRSDVFVFALTVEDLARAWDNDDDEAAAVSIVGLLANALGS